MASSLALAAAIIAISSLATAGNRFGSVSDGWPGQRIMTAGGLSDHSTWVMVMISAPVIRPVARTVVLLTVFRFLDNQDLWPVRCCTQPAGPLPAPLTCSEPTLRVGAATGCRLDQMVGVIGRGLLLTNTWAVPSGVLRCIFPYFLWCSMPGRSAHLTVVRTLSVPYATSKLAL
jgi:hypothetical protein